MSGSATAFQGPGIHSARPAANSGCIFYSCSTHGKIEKSDGSAWTDWLTLPSGVSAAVPALTFGTAAAAGSAGTFVATDATLPIFDATVPSTQAFSDAAAAGAAGVAARRDHKHGMPASPGGGGALVFLDAHPASSSATLDFTTFISSTYDEYVFELVGIVPANDAAMLLMRAGTGGGPTYDTSSIYPYSNFWKAVGTTAAMASWGTTATAVSLFNDSAGGGLSNVAGTSLSGTLHLFNPGSASNPKLMTWETIFNYYADDTYYRVSGGGFYNSATAMTAVRFLMSSGNIASGVIRVYGVAKS